MDDQAYPGDQVFNAALSSWFEENYPNTTTTEETNMNSDSQPSDPQSEPKTAPEGDSLAEGAPFDEESLERHYTFTVWCELRGGRRHGLTGSEKLRLEKGGEHILTCIPCKIQKTFMYNQTWNRIDESGQTLSARAAAGVARVLRNLGLQSHSEHLRQVNYAAADDLMSYANNLPSPEDWEDIQYWPDRRDIPSIADWALTKRERELFQLNPIQVEPVEEKRYVVRFYGREIARFKATTEVEAKKAFLRQVRIGVED